MDTTDEQIRNQAADCHAGKIRQANSAVVSTETTSRKHPFFCIDLGEQITIAEEMNKLRGGRFGAV